MAVRRLNYTGRKRINREDARITLQDSGAPPATFDATLRLAGYGLPPGADVYVEAYRQTTWMRFAFGTVGNVAPPGDRRLAQFDDTEALLFRVRVSSPDDRRGVLLAEADRIRPCRPEEKITRRVPLLPVRPDRDLGSQVFRVDFSDSPILLINAAARDWRGVSRDPAFVSLVFPAVFWEILMRVMCVDKVLDDDDLHDWRCRWVRFAKTLAGVPDMPGETEDQDAVIDWIEEVVSSFCRRCKMMDRFKEYWSKEGDT
jgi:hypothetical protein